MGGARQLIGGLGVVVTLVTLVAGVAGGACGAADVTLPAGAWPDRPGGQHLAMNGPGACVPRAAASRSSAHGQALPDAAISASREPTWDTAPVS